MKEVNYLLFFIVFSLFSSPLFSQIGTNVDADGDGVNDLFLWSDWSKKRWEWGATKISEVTNLSNQPIQFDWPVGGQSGVIQPGKTLSAEWVSWTAVFAGVGNILAKKGGGIPRKQKTSAYNCISDILKDWETSKNNFGTSPSISGEPSLTLQTEFSIDEELSVIVFSDFFRLDEDLYQYIYGVGNLTSDPVQLNWRAARNNENPTGLIVELSSQEFKEFVYTTNSPPSFYGNFLSIINSQEDTMEVDAPSWVPDGEIISLIGANSNNFYKPDEILEDFESYTNTETLELNWGINNQGVLSLETDNNPFDAASNVNNEPPIYGAGNNELFFNGSKSMRVDLQPGTTDIVRTGLNLTNSQGVYIWAMFPNPETTISLSINGIPSNRSYFQNHQISLPQVGGFIGYQFTRTDLQDWEGNINSIAITISSPINQTIFIDEIVSTNEILDNIEFNPEVSQNIQFEVFPNPAKEQLTLSVMGDDWFNENSTFLLFSSTGKLIKAWLPNNSPQFTQTYSIKGLSPGTYFIVLKHKDGFITKKLQVISD